MVRSIWQGALVVTLAYVGLAWSQAARTGNGPGAPAATMTVHENGKDVACKVVATWQQADGSKAYQLQIISTGEMLTLVEDGPATTHQGKAGKVKALSMRIFHWGNRRTSPPGVPVPPENIISDQETAKPVILSESNAHLISLTPDPVLPPGCRMCAPPATVSGGNLACNPCPSGPCLTGPGSSCSESGTVQNHGTGSFPYAQMPAGSRSGSGSQSTEVAGTQTADQGANLPVVQGHVPSKQIPGVGTGPVYQKPATAVVAQGTATPAVSYPDQGTIVQGTIPGQKTGSTTKPAPGTFPAVSYPDQGTIVQGTIPRQKTGMSSNEKIVTVPAQATGPVNSNTTRPATLAGQASSLGQTNPGVQSTQGASQTATKPPHTLGEKIRNIFHHPNQEPAVGVAQKTTAGNTAVAQKTVPAANGVVQKTMNPTVLPSTANTGKAAAPLANTQPLNLPGTTATGTLTTLPRVMPIAQQATVISPNRPATTVVSANTVQASKDDKATEKKTTWEKIWGKPLFAKTKQPGQTTVDPTPTGKGPLITGTKAQMSGTIVAQGMPAGTQVFPAPTTKLVQTPGGQLIPVPASGTAYPPGTLVDVTPTAMPALPPATASNLVPAGPTKANSALTQAKAPMPPASFTNTQNDPLLNPDQIRPSRVEAKLGGLPPTAPLAKTPPPLAGSGPSVPSAGALQNQLPPLPMGSGSVVAAQNGLPIPYRYMPVPMVTVPNPLRNPGPPPPDVPVAPQPTSYVNAFTPTRATPKPGEGQQNPMSPNVVMGPYGPGPYGPDPRMVGYPPQLVAQGMNPYGMNPYMMSYMGQPQVAYNPGMMPPIPQMTPMGMQRPIAQVNYPSNYQGPMPPNPMIGSNMPPMPYPQAMPMPPYGNRAMDRPGLPPAGPGAGNTAHLLGMLRDSISPAEREMAALNLNNQDWRSHPEIVQVLVSSARQDPAATVRASCVRSLAVQNINTEPVLTTLNGLKNDPDPRVRQEVEQALVRLNGGQTSANTLQPISYQP